MFRIDLIYLAKLIKQNIVKPKICEVLEFPFSRDLISNSRDSRKFGILKISFPFFILFNAQFPKNSHFFLFFPYFERGRHDFRSRIIENFVNNSSSGVFIPIPTIPENIRNSRVLFIYVYF